MDVSQLMEFYGNQEHPLTAASQNLGKEDFLTLLVTQLQNQDPFQPLENSEFVAQLAQFSTLEQAENTNQNITALAMLQQESVALQSLAQASDLIGKEVEYNNILTGQTETGVVEAVELKNGTVALKIGNDRVLLGQILKVSEPAPEE